MNTGKIADKLTKIILFISVLAMALAFIWTVIQIVKETE